MRFLVDANVLSEATKAEPSVHVLQWLERNETELAVGPIILGKVRFGILKLPSGRRRQRLESWFAEGIRKIQCLDWDASTGLLWAELVASLRAKGRAMPIKDSMIAATALRYGLTVATRNQRDFAKTGVDFLNPFKVGN